MTRSVKFQTTLPWYPDLKAGTLTCHYCPAVATTLDHIVPRAAGGRDHGWNLVPACEPCNATKASRLPLCLCKRCRNAVKNWRRDPEAEPIRLLMIDQMTTQLAVLLG